MSKEALLIELMDEMIPFDRPHCPNCLSTNMHMNADYEIFCRSCNSQIRPGKDADSQRAYYEILAKGLVDILKGLGLSKINDEAVGITKLENGLKRLMKRKAKPQDYYFLSLVNLLKSGQKSVLGQNQQAYRLLLKARKNMEAGSDFEKVENLRKSALFDDLIAMELAKMEPAEFKQVQSLYESAIKSAQKLLEQADESDQRAARQFLALQYLLQALYFISANEINAEQAEERFLDGPLFDPALEEALDQSLYEEEEIEGVILKMLDLVPGWKDNSMEPVVEYNLIEYLPDLAAWFEEEGDFVMAKELESLSHTLALAFWDAHPDQGGLELLTDNDIALFQNRLEEGESKKALEALDQWLQDWNSKKARELLAHQMTVMILYRNEVDAIYEGFTAGRLFNELAKFMKKIVSYLDSLPKGECYYYNQFLKAQICAKVAFNACMKRNPQEALEYCSRAISTWHALAKTYPELVGISSDLGYELSDLRLCYMYLQDELQEERPLKKMARQVNEIYEVFRRYNNPHARERAFFDESLDIFKDRFF